MSRIKEREYLEKSLYEIFHNTLVDLKYSKCELIFEYGNGVIPKKPFLALHIGDVKHLGSPYFIPNVKGDDGTETYKQPVERTCTMYGFGEESEDILESLLAAHYFENYIGRAKKYKLVLKNFSDLFHNPFNEDNNNGKSYNFTFILGYERIVENNTGYIESVDINGTVIDVDHQHPVHIEVKEV